MLWGIRLIRTGVMRAFGSSLHVHLGKAVSRRLSAFGVGFGVTILLQSSTATALIISSFASKGLVKTSAALAVMLGADIGTSVAAQLLSFDATWIAYLAVFIGVVLHGRSSHYSVGQIGRSLLGIGLVLLALGLIRTSSEPLRESEVLGFVFAALQGEILLTLFLTAVITWLVHSSLAVVLLIAAMSASGVIPLGTGLVMVLGANIGGTVPPILATMNASPEGQHAALGNACFKLTACAIALPFLPWIGQWMSQSAAEGFTIVHVHIAFNAFVAVLFLPLVGVAAKLLMRAVPPTPTTTTGAEAITKYLDPEMTRSPALALINVTRELYRINEYIEESLSLLTESVAKSTSPDLQRIRKNQARVSGIFDEVKLYLTAITREEISDTHSATAIDRLLLFTNMWHVSDLIASAAEQLALEGDAPHQFSVEGSKELLEILSLIRGGLNVALSASLHNDNKVRKSITKQRKELEKRVDSSRLSHFNRLEHREYSSIATSSLHNELLRDFAQIFHHIHAASKIGA